MEEKNKKVTTVESNVNLHSAHEGRCIFREAISKYINLLNSQMDSFPIIINTLAVNVKAKANSFSKFIKEINIKIEENEEHKEITYKVPIESGKEFERLQNELYQSINAYAFVPNNTVVAMVSLYDSYLADLIECAYITRPEMLNNSDRTFSFSDIIQFDNLDKLKQHVIEKDVESIIRESHKKQFELLSKKFNVRLAENLPSFNDFIEITERRNLFVHTNGKVSSQYLKTCKERPFDHKDENVQIGEKLSATPMYVKHCYEILFEIGIKLGQVIWRKIENDLEKSDDLLIDIGYDLIKRGKYSLACIILDFACEPYVKHYNKVCEYVLCVNRALAYYLNGDQKKCNEIINSIDWSATELKYRLAHKVLLEQYEEAIAYMKSIGKTDEMRVAYAEWPLFNDFRKTEQFKDTYKEIYGCNFQYTESHSTKWEDIIQEAVGMIKESKERKSKKGNTKNEKNNDNGN